MSKKPKDKISALGSRITAIISVSLVLVIVGVLASLVLATGRLNNAMLGNISVIVKMDTEATADDIAQMSEYLGSAMFVQEVAYTSAEEVLAQEMEEYSETLELIGENPYSDEYEVKLKPIYVDVDSISMITNAIMLQGNVDEVVSPFDAVRTISSFSKTATWILSGAGLLMLIISLVLIFNTVNLSIYARRFLIRTMHLVGATASYIRRPFILSGVLSGLIAAIIASIIVFAIRYYVASLNTGIEEILSWGETALVCAGLLLIGMAICGLAAMAATTRYLRASYDDLYK